MTDQVWFVTGSSRGLGRAVAEEALQAGARVVATARRTDALAGLAGTSGGRLLTVPLDVTHPAQAQAAIQAAVGAFGRIDVVVNNAGYANLAPVEDITLDDFRAQVDVVFLGTVYVTKAVLPVFRAQGSGYFIQVTSIGGRLTSPGLAAYQSAKFAVEGFSGALRQEVVGLGIKVTLAEPGLMRTDWADSSMNTPAFQAAYRPTVGAMAESLRASNGTAPVDPAKVARVFLDLAKLDEPPLHLVLDSAATANIAAVMAATSAEDQKWAAVGRTVDFDE